MAQQRWVDWQSFQDWREQRGPEGDHWRFIEFDPSKPTRIANVTHLIADMHQGDLIVVDVENNGYTMAIPYQFIQE